MNENKDMERIITCIFCSRMVMVRDSRPTMDLEKMWSRSTYHITFCHMCVSVGCRRHQDRDEGLFESLSHRGDLRVERRHQVVTRTKQAETYRTATEQHTRYRRSRKSTPPEPRLEATMRTVAKMTKNEQILAHPLMNALTNVPDFRDGLLLSMLGPTDVSMIMNVFGLPLSSEERWTIKDPRKCWESGFGSTMITLWVVIWFNDDNNMVKYQILNDTIMEIVTRHPQARLVRSYLARDDELERHHRGDARDRYHRLHRHRDQRLRGQQDRVPQTERHGQEVVQRQHTPVLRGYPVLMRDDRREGDHILVRATRVKAGTLVVMGITKTNPQFNSTCNTVNYGHIPNDVRVRMGNNYCNRGCEAICVGWRCCTCGFKSVVGYYHLTVKMLVHDDAFGNPHGFCNTCLTENEYTVSCASNETRNSTSYADDITAVDREVYENMTGVKYVSPSETISDSGSDGSSYHSYTSSESDTYTNKYEQTNYNVDSNGSVTVSSVAEMLMNLLDVTVDSMDTYNDVIPPTPRDADPTILMACSN
ncbi:hypothetical protein QQS21_010781 [Conoideocrella luteorostrata]|uniref:Uncharacterized protein n=1 Tax=Conoideocrella luteorostrata TaxID=1105319 RepID=A0AAJ0CIT8_9HYPO|nr:hypothetical protein QQS21_010781 [Conoideocrella luteorostrata]